MILVGLASPTSLEAVIRAESLDLRRGELAQARHQLIERLIEEDGWQDSAIARLATGREPPQVRAVYVAALSGVSVVDADQLLWLLGADLPASQRPLSSRIDALTILHARRLPQSAGPMLQVFARSRLDDLPEDPDLFERALRGVLEIEDPQAVRAGLTQGLVPDLLRLVHARLVSQWVMPLSAGIDADHLAPVLDWPDANPQACRRLEAAAQQELGEAFDTHGMALIAALQTDGGSILTAITARMELALVADWAQHDDPDIARIATEIRAELDAPPPLAPPGLRPGQLPDLSLTPPQEVITVIPGNPPAPVPPLALVFGLTGVVIAMLVGGTSPRSRPLAGVVLGFSGLLAVEGALKLTDRPTLASSRPLFSFTDWQTEPFQQRLIGDIYWLETPGGWMRHRQIPPDRPDFRAVVLGASSAHGSNHLAEEAFPALLEQGLRDHFPESSVEVLNLGIGGTTSNGVLYAGTQALALGVDLVVVYYGHNEAAQFSQLSLFETVDLEQLSARMWLSRSALYSALVDLLRPEQALVPVSGSIYARQPPTLPALTALKSLAADNLHHNLTQLAFQARAAGAEVVLMNPATNYRFASLDAFEEVDGSVLEAGLTAAEAAWGAGDAAATATLTEAVLANQEAAGSQPWLAAAELRAHALAALGQPEAARESWQNAIDHSARPGVITTEVRQAIQAVAQEQGCATLDVEALLYARSPDGISAPGLFWDDLHPSQLGHRMISEALLPAVIESAERRL